MNDLEAWFERRLGYLIEPSWPVLALEMIDALKEERHQLAHWLMKTAVIFSLASLQGIQKVAFQPEITRGIKNGRLPDHCWVDLAHSRLGSVASLMSGCFRVINGGRYNPSQVLRGGLGFRFTVQFNHVLLRIGRAPGADVTYQSWQGEQPVRLYPDPRRTPGVFSYESIRRFEDSLLLETWRGCPGNVA